jgi:hypothetical protein
MFSEKRLDPPFIEDNLKGFGRSLVIKASSLLLRCYEVRSLFHYMFPAIMFFLTTGQKSMVSADYGLKPLKW